VYTVGVRGAGDRKGDQLIGELRCIVVGHVEWQAAQS
jgi:hypothetical protein